MKSKAAVVVLGVAIIGGLTGLSAKRHRALAAPAAVTVPSGAPLMTAAGPMTDILSGRAFPTTLTSQQISTSYHLVSIVDTQGKPGTYATKGETVTLGSETFLAAYFVPLTSGVGKPPEPKPDETAQLGLINMRYITVLYNIHAVGAPLTDPAKETSTP